MTGITLCLSSGRSISCSIVSVTIFIGTLPILFIHDIPKLNNCIIILLMLVLFFILSKVNQSLKLVLLVFIAFLWACYHCGDLIENINFLSRNKNSLDVTVVSVPLNKEVTERIKVRIDKINKKAIFPPLYTIWKLKHKSNIPICLGQTWLLNGTLKPIHHSMNEGGYDQQRFNISQRVIGTYKNPQAKVINRQCAFRQIVINSYFDKIASLDNSGIVYALMFGERGMLPAELSQLFQKTGLSHLIAISGLHIGMSYLFGFWLLLHRKDTRNEAQPYVKIKFLFFQQLFPAHFISPFRVKNSHSF